MRAGKCLAIIPSLCLGKWDPGVMVERIFEVCLILMEQGVLEFWEGCWGPSFMYKT